MRKLIVLLSVLMVLLAALPTAFAQKGDTVEDDPNTLSFTSPDAGVPLLGEFLTDSAAQLYVFNGSAGDMVTITMYPTDELSFLDTMLVLLGEAGQVYAANDDSENSDDPSLSSRIEVELPVDGSYYILATTAFAAMMDNELLDEPLGYELLVEGFTNPADMEESNFRYAGAEVEVGGSADLLITEVEPVYYVTFIAEENQTLDIVTTPDEVSDTLLMLFDNNGVGLAMSDDENGLAAEINGVTLADAGKHLVLATSFNYRSAVNEGWTGGTFGISIAEGSASK
jgi:hypothetical protein